MDYDKLIESFRGIACIVSRRQSDGGEGPELTIASANRNYLASVDKLDEEFVPNRPYTYYVSYDPNFEFLVNSCILNGKISHQYINADLYNAWLDLFMIPLEEDEKGNGYCLFTYEMNFESDSDKMINISARTAYMVLKTCFKFSENYDFKETMDSIVRDIRNQCESDGCAIILTDRDNRRIDICCFDHAGEDAFAPADEDVFFKPEFYDIVEGWHDIMGGSNCIIITNEDELKDIKNKDINWYNSLIASGVNSLVLYPLRIGDNLYGYIFATNFNSEQTAFIREIMELNSFVLSAEVENYRMHRKLEMLSKTDMLTGMLNRNAMGKRISDIESGEEATGSGLGIIFADLNGLKNANDSIGHDEGDEMLKSVASKLRTVFDDNNIYRAGGDEFLVIVTNMERDDFNTRFDRLKSLSEVDGEPSFALGANYEDGRADIADVMRVAEKNMYMHKAKYYESHPELNRRVI